MNIWKDFYPTSNDMIHKMRNKVNFRLVETVLEPSCGKGNIIERLEKLNTDKYKKLDFDAIEINPELQQILKGKNIRLIHDDFLTFNTNKKYDLIIANPPFSEGDKHLLKAIDIVKPFGGQIVFLLNAETIKNPYSKIRKDLLTQLEKYEAEITYYQNSFSNAERKTDVEIALIYIKIEGHQDSSIIFDKLEKDNDIRDINYNQNAVINGDYIHGLIEQCDFELKAGVNLIQEYIKLNNLMFKNTPDRDEKSYYSSSLELKCGKDGVNVNEFVRQTRVKYWKALFNSNKFKSLLTQDLRKQYMSKIEDLANYNFNEFNIRQVQRDISIMLKGSLEDTIINLFDELSYQHSYNNDYSKNIHMYNGWKTNTAYMINKKVIIPLSALSWYSNRLEINSYTVKDKLRDIEKVFNYLDTGNTTTFDALDNILDLAHEEGRTKKIQLKHFNVTFYKKGTCHVEFTNLETLKRFNIYGSQKKGWLPQSFGHKKYKHMSTEEKAVIDDFQGEKEYNEVVKNPNRYIWSADNTLKLTMN